VKLTGQRSLCRGCNKVFSTTSTFDRHRVGEYPDRRCLTAEELTAKGWSEREGIWRTPRRAALPFWRAQPNERV